MLPVLKKNIIYMTFKLLPFFFFHLALREWCLSSFLVVLATASCLLPVDINKLMLFPPWSSLAIKKPAAWLTFLLSMLLKAERTLKPSIFLGRWWTETWNVLIPFWLLSMSQVPHLEHVDGKTIPPVTRNSCLRDYNMIYSTDKSKTKMISALIQKEAWA